MLEGFEEQTGEIQGFGRQRHKMSDTKRSEAVKTLEPESMNLYLLLPMWDAVAVGLALNLPKEYFLNQGWPPPPPKKGLHLPTLLESGINPSLLLLLQLLPATVPLLEPEEETLFFLLSSYLPLVPSISRNHQEDSWLERLRNVACRLLAFFSTQNSTEVW